MKKVAKQGPAIVPVCTTSGGIWYAISCDGGFLHPTPDGAVIVKSPYTFACKENAEAFLRGNDAAKETT